MSKTTKRKEKVKRTAIRRTKKTTAPRKVMVIVHGGGSFPDDYYVPLVEKIREALQRPFDYIPVYYADVPRARVAAATVTPAEAKFQVDMEREFRRSFETILADQARSGVVGARMIPIDQFIFTAKELTQYFFDAGIRDEIEERLIEKLDEAKQNYDEIVLNSLSLGTVVSLGVLRRLATRYKISLWFTCGSPLAKLRRIGAFDASLGAITVQNVAHWHNVYDDTDYVGDPIGPAFPGPGYRIHDIFVNVGSGLFGSHDYWNNQETIEMLADAMR